MAGTELTDGVNPLEAGLYHAVSLSKGCYVGQETLAKVHNLKAVKQQLWGLRLSSEAAAGMPVIAGGCWASTLVSPRVSSQPEMRAGACVTKMSRNLGFPVQTDAR